MKRVLFISLGIWILLANFGKIWPISAGDRYYQRLQKWYVLANKGEWQEAGKVALKLKNGDIADFTQKNNSSELARKLNSLVVKPAKNADDWMEMAIIYYRLNQRDEAYRAITNAYKLDPIREDISKIYFTFQTFQTSQISPPSQLQ
jgi:cytochrome c-type biogenesis protein CcmH/NrfG